MLAAMSWWVAILVGLGGAIALEAVQFRVAIRRTGDWPWKSAEEPRPWPFLVSIILRFGIAAGVTAIFFVSGQISNPLAAFTIGLASPGIVEQLARLVAKDPVLPAGTSAAEASSIGATTRG
jgi:hypothetical protein